MAMTPAQMDTWIAQNDMRLAKLEGVGAESPNGAMINVAGQKLLIKGVVWEITSNQKLRRNGQLRDEVNLVTVGFRDHDTFVQGTSFGGFYRAQAQGDWGPPPSPGAWTDLQRVDPRIVIVVPPQPPQPPIPPQPTGAPPQAAAVGYTTRTLGPAVTVGNNWFRTAMYGLNPAAMNVVSNANGTVTLAGPWSYNGQIMSVDLAGGFKKGIAFGGGAYFEATFSFSGGYTGDGGWPAWWSHDIEGLGVASTQWPGQAPGYNHEIEPDFCEYWGDRNWGSTIHDWYGGGDVLESNRNFVLPPGVDRTQPHRYGALWVPAKPGVKGYMSFWFDGVHIENNWDILWNQYNPALPPPPVRGSSAYSVLDSLHLALILGTGAKNPMTIHKVEVWQGAGANNLVR